MSPDDTWVQVWRSRPGLRDPITIARLHAGGLGLPRTILRAVDNGMCACMYVRASCSKCCESVCPNVNCPTYKSPLGICPCYREASQGLVDDGVGGSRGNSASAVAEADRRGIISGDNGGGVNVKMPVCQEEVDC